MPMTRANSVDFHLRLYAGELQDVVLLKRGDDQKEGTVTAFQLFSCWRDNISKTGQPIQGDMAASHSTRWLIPSSELVRVGVNYLNVLDRIVDQYNMYWQPESGQDLTLSQFENYYWVACIRVDPSPNNVLLGIPGIPLGLA